MTLLDRFQQAYRNLELLPLSTPKELDRFRVPYGDSVLEELVQLIEDSPAGDSKVIFSGHRGCGKSTLLAEFSRSQLLGDRYFIVLFSIAKAIEMSDIDTVNVLFAIALNLMLAAEKHDVELPASTKAAIYDWFSEITQTDSREAKLGSEFALKFLDNISLKIQADAASRSEIKRKFERKDTELVAQLNIIAAALQSATNKTILVIIDDLDKLNLSVVEPMFRDNIKTLCLPGFCIIYTVPIAILRDKRIKSILKSELNNQIVPLPVLKLLPKAQVHQPDAAVDPAVMNILCEILHRRIPEALIDRQTAEQLIRSSGGVLREVVRIANECCRICLRLIRRQPERQDIKIDAALLQEAIQNIRNDFAIEISKLDYQILQQTYTNLEPDDPAQQEFLDLLHSLHILEYRNGDVWYDVHPIVVDLLQQRGLV